MSPSLACNAMRPTSALMALFPVPQLEREPITGKSRGFAK